MLRILIGAEIVGSTGDTTWTEIKLQASDDPCNDHVDLSSTDCEIGTDDSVLIDTAELRRALDLLDTERAIHLNA